MERQFENSNNLSEIKKNYIHIVVFLSSFHFTNERVEKVGVFKQETTIGRKVSIDIIVQLA